MKLALFSGGDEEENINFCQQMMKTILPKKKLQFTFIPPSFHFMDIEFREFVQQFKSYNVSRFINLPIDLPLNKVIIKEAFNSDLIHLGGGNTFHFLNELRKKGFLSELKKFVQRGGVLSGLSAGAILMSPTIDMASIPKFDCDENYGNIRNLTSLNLVPFNIFPHYKNSERYNNCLLRYSKKTPLPIYAIQDGSGIIVDENTICFHGKVILFYQGKMTKLGVK